MAPFPTRNTRQRGTPQTRCSSPARGPKLGRDAMRGHGEAASDRRRWRARPSLGNRPVTRSLGGGWVGSSWGVPRGLLPAVGRSWCPPSRWVRGTLHLGPPRDPPRDAPPSAPQGKKKSHPPCARRGSAVGAVHPNGHDSVASAPSRSTPTKVSLVTLTTATGRHGNVEQLVYDGGVCPASRPGRSGQVRRMRRSDADFSAPVGRVGSGGRGPLIWYWPAAERWARQRRAGGRGLDVADVTGPRRVAWSATIPRRGQCQWLHSQQASSVPWSWEGGWMSISWWARERSCAASASSGFRSSTTTGAPTPAFPRQSFGWRMRGAELTSGTGRISSGGPVARPGCPSRPGRSRRQHRQGRSLRVVAEPTAAYDPMATTAWLPRAGQWGRGDSLVPPGYACYRMTSGN